MINLRDFLESKSLKFDSDKQGVSWVKRNLSPKELLKVGPNYLVDEKEINQLFAAYLRRQRKVQEMKKIQAKKMTALKKRRKEKPS